MRHKWRPNRALRRSIHKDQHNTMVRFRLGQPGWSRKGLLREGYRLIRMKIRGKLTVLSRRLALRDESWWEYE